MSAIRTFLPLFGRQLGWMGLALLLSLMAVGAGIGLLGSSGWFLTAAALSTASAAFNIFGPSAAVRGFAFLRILARYFEKMAGHDGTLRLLSNLRGWLFARLFPLVPLNDRDSRHGDLVSRLTADVDALDTAFLVAIGPILSSVVVGMGMTIALSLLLPAVAWCYGLTFAGAVALVPAGVLAASRRAGARVVEETSALRVATLDALDGHADLIAFGALDAATTSFRGVATTLARTRTIPMTVAAAGAAGVQLAMGAAVVGALLLGLPALADGTISAPLYVGLLLAIIVSFEPTLVLVRAIGKLAVAGAAAERLDRIATREPAIAEPLHAAPLPAGSNIAYDDIGFSYPESRRVLDHLDIAIPAGSRIAIVGESGSGKSTLLKLLLRLADPQQGRVTIAGADIRTVPLAALHARVALLSQDAPVFHDTIRNNLLVGRPDATDADLWAALEAGQLADVVRALPRGLDSVVGETGRTLSAGQARRLCLARTLLSGAEILAFDEPTSGLDPENEQAFFAALAKAALGRTLLIITHAALPPGIVDRTYRMNEGVLAPVY